MLIDATMQSKNPKKSTRRGHKRSTSRGTRKDQTEHQERCRKTPLGDSLSTVKLANFGCPCRRVRLAKKNNQRPQTEHQRDQRFCQNGAPASPIREHKRNTRKYNQRPQTEHQRDQRFSQNGAPASPIRKHK